MYNNLNQYDDSIKSAVKRTIISRAYYSIFLYLRDYLMKKYPNYKTKKNEHNYIIKFIEHNKIFDLKRREFIVNKLKCLKTNRVYCDYKYTKPKKIKFCDELNIKELLNDCETVFIEIKNYEIETL